jgi:ribonucleoside-diphosphate reductase alpha chain
MLNENGLKVFEARYAGRDENGNINETFEQAVDRLVNSVYNDKHPLYKDTRKAILNLELVPSTPIWANIGKGDRPWQPGACFVLDIEDSLEDMYRALKDTALIFKSGGGIGYNFSSIRPKGSLVMSTKGKASGVVELIKLYDASSNMVMQGGVRRGASMGILNVDHPEIMEFIRCKLDGGITNFNLSVGITDEFMKALELNTTWDLKFGGKVHKTVYAREIWDAIAEAAHACGDPGLIFLDKIQAGNPVPSDKLNKTNPCGEQPLANGESCLLLSINLAKIMNGNRRDLQKLDRLTRLATRFLDALIDVAEYPLPLIDENTKASRKIGIGFTGLHDALIMAGLPYDSPKGRKFAAEITTLMSAAAKDESMKLAEELGPFPKWEQSIYYPDTPIRNASRITIAPTGSVTAMAGCEGYGVEPIFGIAYKKATNVAGDFYVFSPLFLEACKKHNVPQEVLDEVGRRGSCQGVEGIPLEIQRIFKGAMDIHYKDHIAMQAAVQANLDNAVSKTINMRNDATVEDIKRAYLLAFEAGCKGITVYRDGCKEGVVTVGAADKPEEKQIGPARGEVVPRPDSTQGVTRRLDTGCGKLYLTANFDNDGNIIETFITTGSDGGCLIFTEATSRLISLAIRGGIPVEEVIEQLNSTHPCPSYMMSHATGRKTSKGKSCASAIANVLKELRTKPVQKATTSVGAKNYGVPTKTETNREKCPNCGGGTVHIEGCTSCPECGYSRC